VERREFIAMLASTPGVSIPGDADAQSATPAAAPKPLSVTLLGTGTPSPSLERQSSGYLIEAGHDLIVWDHGPGAHHRLLQSGHRAVDVTHAFFTHLHYDHCLDYVRLLMTRWDQGAGRIPELRVYGPAYTARMTEAIIGERGLFAPGDIARITRRPHGGLYPEDQLYRLWTLLLTEIWAGVYLDHRGAAPMTARPPVAQAA